jgi:hypothetical protein
MLAVFYLQHHTSDYSAEGSVLTLCLQAGMHGPNSDVWHGFRYSPHDAHKETANSTPA